MTRRRTRAVVGGVGAVMVVAVIVGLLALLPPGPDPIPPRGPVPPPPSVPAEAAVLVGAADIATCDGTADEATAALLEAIPGTVFAAGDLAYPDGSERDFASCYDPSWGRVRDRTRPAIGNHELEADSEGDPYFAYFGSAAGAPGAAWYTFTAGAWRVVVLDSNCGEVDCSAGGPQMRWLAETLRAEPSRCLAAMWHHPRFSSGQHGDDERLRVAWDALQAAGAELVLTGHDHHYERFAPMRSDGTADPDGLRQFIVGTGGARLRPVGDRRANSEMAQSDSHGVLRLTLTAATYDWTFIPVPGDTFTDSGSAPCR